MSDDREYVPFAEWSLRWRWEAESLSPPDDLRPLRVEACRKLWRKYVGNERHLMMIKAGDHHGIGGELASMAVRCETNEVPDPEAARIRTFLDEFVGAPDDASTLHFWSSAVGAETTWQSFRDQWDVFCYPDDDSNVAVLPLSDRVVAYVEERFWVHLRA